VRTTNQYFKVFLIYISVDSYKNIERLLKNGDVMHCAGGFVKELMPECLGKLEGEDSTIEGLSASVTRELIKQAIENLDLKQ